MPSDASNKIDSIEDCAGAKPRTRKAILPTPKSATSLWSVWPNCRRRPIADPFHRESNLMVVRSRHNTSATCGLLAFSRNVFCVSELGAISRF